jgi:hypothetical protein
VAKITYEAFQAEFTGKLKVCTLNNGKRYTLLGKLPRVERGRFYMIAYDPATSNCRLLDVLTPEEMG